MAEPMTKAELLADMWEQAGGRILTHVDRDGNHKAACPFHEDRNPSASVNLESGLFNCFSCGKAGDVYTFIQWRDDTDFPGAARIVDELVEGDVTPKRKGKPKAYRPSWL